MVKAEMNKFLVEYIGEAAMFEQLAEEATELAHAALKMARSIRRENPTPLTREEIWKMVNEEYTDLIQCSNELGLLPDVDQMDRKRQRALERLHKLAQERDQLSEVGRE